MKDDLTEKDLKTLNEDIKEDSLQSRSLSNDRLNQIAKNLETPLGIIENGLIRATYTLAHLFILEDIKPECCISLVEKLSYSNAELKECKDIIFRSYNNQIRMDEMDNIESLEDLFIEISTDKVQVQKLVEEVEALLEKPKHYNEIISNMGSDTVCAANPDRKEIYFERIRRVNGKDYGSTTIVLDGYFDKVTVYESPLDEEPRRFEVLVESNALQRPRRLGPDLVEDLVLYLKELGLVKSNRYIVDTVPAILNAYVKQGIAEIKQEIETPGFFYNTKENKLVAVHYEVKEPENEDLEKAVNILEELREFFNDQETKLASIIKWGLISPFSFAKKQMGVGFIPWLFLYGRAKSGKTTMGYIISYLWGEPNEQNDISGDAFGTVARVGDKLSKHTYPIIVNEPAGALSDVRVVEIIKSAIERTTSRGKLDGRRYKTIPSFSPVIFTSNHYMPTDDALVRRFYIQSFSHNEKKEEEEIKLFEERMKIKTPYCLLNGLKPLANFITKEIMEEPDLLEMDWQELINTLMFRLYTDLDRKVPEWLLGWSKSETMEDLDNELVESIRIFLLERINKETTKINVMGDSYSEERVDVGLKTSDDFTSKVWNVLNERLIPWLHPYNKNGKDYVCFTVGFKSDLHKFTEVCQPLKSIGELLGWKYQGVRMEGNVTKVIIVSLDKFISFLYPSFER